MGRVISEYPSPAFRVCVVCSGNICRSPIAEKVLAAALVEAGLTDVAVSSAGTGPWHVGDRADARARQVLTDAGYDATHTARQIDRAELAELDLVLAADRSHVRTLQAMTADPEKVRLLLDFAPGQVGQQVPDPYYSTGLAAFSEVLALAKAATAGVIAHIRAELGR